MMAFALWAKQVKCPNCGYEGAARVKGSGCGMWLIFLVLFFVSFLFWPLFLVSAIMFLWLLLKPADQICPKCKYPHPVPRSSRV